jgi:hypothetical protein
VKYRNWKEIAKIEDPFLMLTLSTIRSSGKEGVFGEAETLARAFPNCFCEAELPRVKLKDVDDEFHRRWKEAQKDVGDDQDMIEPDITAIMIAFGVPVFTFAFNKRIPRSDPSFIMDWLKTVKPLTAFVWHGAKFVAVHTHNINGKDDPTMKKVWFAPADCIEFEAPVKALAAATTC